MVIIRSILIVLIAFTFSVINVNAQKIKNNHDFSFELAHLKYEELPLGSIQPEGWLMNQLLTMKNGSTGHLDEYYYKLKNDNGWLGGKGDGWEETPYWLDGAVPLAYLLNDDSLKTKVLKYINWSLDNQRPSGFFGPYSKSEREGKNTFDDGNNGDDWWPRMVMLKVMQQYYMATNDKRVISFMTKYFNYQLKNIDKCPLDKWSGWAKARGGDNIMMVYWLYRITHEPYLLKLADKLYVQTTRWTNLMGGRNWVIEAAANQTSKDWMERHGVNVGMGIKLPCIYFEGKKNEALLDSMKTGFNDLMTLHGLPNGMFSADEDLHGNLPTQGTELCAVVETLFSLEEMISITGNKHYMDAAERIAYNALPAQTTDDYVSRQYFQMVNQVKVTRGVYNFSLPFNRGMNNVYGPYAGYTCCTANMHQGWTKFTSHLWYGTSDNGLAAIFYAPNTIRTVVNGNVPLVINETTNYPFDDNIIFHISISKKTTFPIEFRIPEWCEQPDLLLNGIKLKYERNNNMIKISGKWNNNDEIKLRLPMKFRTGIWARNSRTIERGPLVFALKIEEEWTKDTLSNTHIKNGEPYYEIKPLTDWNYGLPEKVIDDPEKYIQIEMKSITGYVWGENGAPLTATTTGKKIPGWVLVNGVADQPVTTREGVYQGIVEDHEVTITLLPYGCTRLRIAAFPVVK